MNVDIRRIAISCGRELFKVRSFTPIPLILIMLFCFRYQFGNHILTWSCGVLLLICGEGLRLWALRYIGKFSRTRKRKGRMLVSNGPYAFMRNPLYVGNLLLWVGFTVISELIWLIPAIVIFFFIQYQCIVLWEEECLREFFPSEAEDYLQRVPRWIPNWRSLRNYFQRLQLPSYDWAHVLKREQGTLQGILIGCAAMVIKDLLS